MVILSCLRQSEGLGQAGGLLRCLRTGFLPFSVRTPELLHHRPEQPMSHVVRSCECFRWSGHSFTFELLLLFNRFICCMSVKSCFLQMNFGKRLYHYRYSTAFSPTSIEIHLLISFVTHQWFARFFRLARLRSTNTGTTRRLRGWTPIVTWISWMMRMYTEATAGRRCVTGSPEVHDQGESSSAIRLLSTGHR